MKRIAIVYKTKTGTTKEAADIIKRTLEKSDFQVDLIELDSARDLKAYEGVIVGAPINGFKWIPEATAFVDQNVAFLNSVPTALYAMNYLGEMGRQSIKNTITKGFAGVKATIKPLDVVLFGGKIDKELPGFVRLLFGVKKGAPLSVMNPEAIEAWAEMIKQKF